MRFVVWGLICLGVTSGCIQSHRAPPVVYYVPVNALAPTSDRPTPRVYVPETSSPGGVVSSDSAIADNVRNLLNGDVDLAAISQNVLVTVKNGVVTLRGNTPSETDRIAIVEQVSKIPGVVRVRDKLGLSAYR